MEERVIRVCSCKWCRDFRIKNNYCATCGKGQSVAYRDNNDGFICDVCYEHNQQTCLVLLCNKWGESFKACGVSSREVSAILKGLWWKRRNGCPACLLTREGELCSQCFIL